MNDLLTCDECGDVIGVYEPMMLAGEDRVIETSRAACPDVAAGGEHYHRACYAQRVGAGAQAAPERVGAGAQAAPIGARSRY